VAIQGLRTTANWIANARPESWRQNISLLYINGQAPLTALTTLMKEQETTDPHFHWFEKGQQTYRVQITTSLNNTDVTTSLVLTSGALAFKLGDILLIEHTNEIVVVSADPTADTGLTVTRGFAGTTKTALTIGSVNPFATHIGSCYEEGSLAPVGIAFDPTEAYNYTQIFRDTHEITGTAAQTEVRTGDEWKEQKREALEKHSFGMEKAFWFGVRSLGTRNGKPLRTTGGVLQGIPSGNKHTYSAAVTMGAFEEDLYKMFQYGSNEKMGFCGNRALLTMQQLVRKTGGVNYNITSGEKEYGMNVTRFMCPFGTLVLKTHPMFNLMGSVVGTYAAMDAAIVALDMDQIKYRYLRGRDTKYQTDLQEIGADAKKNGYITECGIAMGHAKTHYAIFGLTSAAAEA
jgi:hypothetical protein